MYCPLTQYAIKTCFQLSWDFRYWSITVLRILLLKESDPRKWDIVLRMVTHNEEHAKDAETWSMYKEQVVDFLRQKCGLADRFSEKDVFHVLGALDVNSVKIHCPGGRRNKVINALRIEGSSCLRVSR